MPSGSQMIDYHYRSIFPFLTAFYAYYAFNANIFMSNLKSKPSATSYFFLNHQRKYRNGDLVTDSEYRIAELLAAIHFVKASSHLPSPGASPADRKGQVENQVRNVHGNEETQREASHAQVLELRCELFWRLEEFLAEQTSERAWYAKSRNNSFRLMKFMQWKLNISKSDE